MAGDFDSENGALAMICESLGGTRFEQTGGDSSKADGHVVMSEGSEIEVEVTRDLSKRFMNSAAELEKFEGPFKLSHGSGSWQVLFDSRTKVKELAIKAQALVDDVVASKRIRTPELRAAFAYSYDGLHVAIIQRVGDSPDQLACGFQETASLEGNRIDSSPDGVGNYAQEYIDGVGSRKSGERRVSKFENLVRRAQSNGRVAHFALVASFPRNSGVWHALTLSPMVAKWDYQLPRQTLSLPDGIDGFWVLLPDFSAAVVYLRNRGWFRFPASDS